MNRPEVSVVMSVFNGARYLRAALESVLSQRGVDLECLVVDDGSTDATADVLMEYATARPQLRVLRQANRGLTAALIHGCAQARGEFIARQDADDISHPGRLAAQVAFLREAPELAFVSCWAQAIGPEGEVLLESRPRADAAEATAALIEGRQGPTAHGSVVMRRAAYEAVGGYRPEFHYGQDSDLWIRLAERGRLAFVPDVLYSYRLTPDNVSLGQRRLQRRYGLISRECQRLRQRGGDESALLRQAAALKPAPSNGRERPSLADGNYFIGSCLKRRRDPRARRYLWLAIRERPWHARAWARLLG